jgi:glucosyl-dolichyl phosphate glucuronosyltransferase
MAPRVTIAICTRNRATFLGPAIESVLPQLADLADILVIDNASTDNTPEVIFDLQARHPMLRSYREERKGIPHAHNAALRNATGKWVLFFDDDEIAPENWIRSYIQFFERHANSPVACVGGGYEPRFETPPPRWFNISRARYYEGEEEKRLTGPAFPWCGNCAYLREAALEMGGFCTDLVRTDETDLSMRLHEAGYEIWWLPRNAIAHILPGARLTVRSVGRLAFVEGRDYGRLRMRHLPREFSRETYRFGRILFSPVYAGFLFAMALLTLPIRHGQVASRHLYRALRALGMAVQLVCDIGRKRPTDVPAGAWQRSDASARRNAGLPPSA